LIPECVYSEEEYYEKIFAPIIRDFRKYDNENIMEHHFLNSRGAIARFDRGAIEIRVMDIQECPLADLAIVSAITALLRKIIDTKISTEKFQKEWSEDRLLKIFKDVVKDGENTVIEDAEYLKAFGLNGDKISVSGLWKKLYEDIKLDMPENMSHEFVELLKKGTLSTRIINNLQNDISSENILSVYSQISNCLQNNKIYI
jgi:carboxylate-amine ligase